MKVRFFYAKISFDEMSTAENLVDATTHITGDTSNMAGETAHTAGETAHMAGETAHTAGETAHTAGETAHSAGETAHQPPLHHHNHHHHHNEPQPNEEETQRLTIVVLGSRGAGKTSLVRQFVHNEFTEECHMTSSKCFYYVSAVVNERLYELKLVDCPAINRFPSNSIQEWNDYRGYGLRQAAAYLLVYDVTDDESFRYIRSMRDQVTRTRNTHDVPIFVAANKHDLHQQHQVHHHVAESRSTKRDISNVVRKQWKCGYIECSAKFNWRVVTVFKELIRSVDHIRFGHKPTSTRVHDAIRNNRCVIL